LPSGNTALVTNVGIVAGIRKTIEVSHDQVSGGRARRLAGSHRHCERLHRGLARTVGDGRYRHTRQFQQHLKSVHDHLGADHSSPLAIVLTHGHFDHAGSARKLAEHWRVQIYAHRLEFPFINGTTAYPPPDPTVGGFMAQVVRFMPNLKFDLRPYLRELPAGELPFLEGWEVVETPGHTAGHVSLFRREDRTLLAGDAFTTVNQDSLIGMLSRKQQVWRPPAYYTTDWGAAWDSVRRLADLEPRLLAAGHGEPMRDALEELRALARNFPFPDNGRYVGDPARSDESGIGYLPPPVADPVKRFALAAVAGAALAAAALWYARARHARVEQPLRRAA
jgi:glyoxylase-like metal-dependent hydrolase (beta-lactamase superfamily II)